MKFKEIFFIGEQGLGNRSAPISAGFSLDWMGSCLSCLKAPPAAEDPAGSGHAPSDPELASLRGTDNNDLGVPYDSFVHSNGNSRDLPRNPLDHELKRKELTTLPIMDKPRSFYYTMLQADLNKTLSGSTSQTSGLGSNQGLPGSSTLEISDAKISSLFDSYRDSNQDVILADGIERLCKDLGVLPVEFKVLLFAWQLKAEQMCRFTREEWMQGCRSLCCDSIDSIRLRLPNLEDTIRIDPEQFKELYRFTFRFGLDLGERILPTEMAITLWQLVFTGRSIDGQLPSLVTRWFGFLEAHPDHIRGIPRDTWNMFLNLIETVRDGDLASYDDTEAWPSLFDDFVEYENDRTNQNERKQQAGTTTISALTSLQ